jgi:integrase
VIRHEWETAYLAAILCLNTIARGCELKGLQWCDVDLFARTLTTPKPKTAAGERAVPLTDVSVSALGRPRRNAEGIGAVVPSHYVFPAFVPKFTFSGKKVIDYNLTGFDPTRYVKSWRTAWRTLTKSRACLGSGSTICGTVPSPRLRRAERRIQRSCRLPGTSAAACRNGAATCGWKRSGKPWKSLL